MWRVGQLTSLHGLHHDDGLAVTSSYLIAAARIDYGVFPVGIVDLKLHELYVGVVGQQLFEMFRRGMKGEAIVADESLLLQLFHVVPDAEAVELVLVPLVNAVEQVEIDIARPRTFQTDVNLVLGLFLALADRGIQLVGQIVALAGIAVAEGGFGGCLGTLLDECGVEVFAAGGDEGIHHLSGLFEVDVFGCFLSGQSHHAESQFHAVVSQ